MEDQGYFSEVGLYRSVLAPAPMPGMFSSSWCRESTFFTRNLRPTFRKEMKEPVIHLPILRCLQLKIIRMPQWRILGRCVLIPFTGLISNPA